MPEFEQYEGRGPPPPMVNDYNHGRMQEEEGYGIEEYEMPPEPPIPEPIIPTAMYYDLPAGLMAPLVGVRFLSVIILLEGGDREGVVRWLWAANLLRDQSLFIIFFWGGVKDFKGGDHMEFRGDIGGGGQLLPTEYKGGTMENWLPINCQWGGGEMVKLIMF